MFRRRGKDNELSIGLGLDNEEADEADLAKAAEDDSEGRDGRQFSTNNVFPFVGGQAGKM